MKRKNPLPLTAEILQKMAPQIGAKVIIEPSWNIVGQIIFKNGIKRYFKYSSLDLNSLGASEVARDKDYTNFFMKRLGYPVVPHSKTFFSEEWGKVIGQEDRTTDAACLYAQKMKFPVIVKPNSGSQGVGVFLVYSKQEIYQALCDIFKKDRIALVQKYLRGKDYRFVVLDDEVVCVYERTPLNIIGTGTKTILQLLNEKQKKFIASNRDVKINIDDPRIIEKLKHQKMNMQSVPLRGERIYLLDNANLSSGGDAYDVIEKVHPFFKEVAVRLTKEMGLRFCGVDMIIDKNISEKSESYWILEINHSPGLGHYSKIGKKQEKIVEGIYLKILKKMEVLL